MVDERKSQHGLYRKAAMFEAMTHDEAVKGLVELRDRRHEPIEISDALRRILNQYTETRHD